MKLIRPYFKAVNSDLYEDKDRWETTQIGRNIETHTKDFFPDVKFAEIAVFNIPEYEGSGNTLSESDCKIRALFYAFHHHNLPKVVDLGILELMPSRKETFNIIEIVCKELLRNGIIPFIIGGGHDLSYAVYKAYASLDKFINLTTCLLYTSDAADD